MDPEINLLVDDGYINSKSLVRADRFDSANAEEAERNEVGCGVCHWLHPHYWCVHKQM